MALGLWVSHVVEAYAPGFEVGSGALDIRLTTPSCLRGRKRRGEKNFDRMYMMNMI